jgi:hypothetical protein
MSKEKLSSPLGCTVGAIQVPGGLLFFKNRDLKGKYVTERVTVWQSTPEVHALKGNNLETGESEGIAVGVNRHGVCVANTHIVSTSDMTYDLLCEELVLQVRSQDDIFGIVERYMRKHAVQGGRILLAAPGWATLVEVLGDRFAVEELEGNVAITNSFSLIDYRPERSEEDEQSSDNRLRLASEALPSLTTGNAIKGLLRSHIPEKGRLSICSHWADGGGTESSHIIQIRGDYVGWSSTIGFPCENDYCTLQLFQA